MPYVYRPEGARIPLKIWMSQEEYESLGPEVKEQAENLARLPFAFHHVALMPDAHKGYGMPIGGVLATKGYVVPNAVGVDIGCGMRFVRTDIDADEFMSARTERDEPLLQAIITDIGRRVPVGFAHHSKPQSSHVLSNEFTQALTGTTHEAAMVFVGLDQYLTALGTLGGGNHFIEIQRTDDGKIAVMIHTGSRNLGKAVCDVFNRAAVKLNERYFSQVPKNWELAFLPTSDPLGDDYLRWMYVAQAFARENREKIMEQIKASFHDFAGATLKGPITFSGELDVHHNYATVENHFGENVLVHRKGAIQARAGRLGIIPGAMGAPSYIVEGLGNPESFMTASHGAGRAMSRKKAMEIFKQQGVQPDFFLSTDSVEDVLSEWRDAYKNIDQVLANESDLVKPVLKLRTLGVIKARDERRW